MSEHVESFFAVARRGAVVRRGLLFAVIVGPVLIAINHYDAILAGDVSVARGAKMALTMVVPYVVSTVSSVGAIRGMQRRGEGRTSRG